MSKETLRCGVHGITDCSICKLPVSLQAMYETVSKPVDNVDHPSHYGGDTTYEVIKVLSSWNLLGNFCLANVVKYIARADKKGSLLADLKKARWYLDYEIKRSEGGK